MRGTLRAAKLGCAAGLAALESRKYKLAARKFTELGVELGNSYEEVISPQDVAVYGGLCALASLDRAELKERVLDNISFRAALEAGFRLIVQSYLFIRSLVQSRSFIRPIVQSYSRIPPT